MKSIFLLLLTLSAWITTAQAQSSISAGRAIEIRIQGVPTEEMQRVNNTYPVSAAGYIRMPFIGNLQAAGKTPNSLAAYIEAAYKSAQIYTNPTVQVLADSDATLKEHIVTVGGYVRRSGAVPYTPGLTIYQAIQNAGGANEFGSMYRVMLFRNGKVKEYNMTENQAKGVRVEPNDTIEVPQKNWLGR